MPRRKVKEKVLHFSSRGILAGLKEQMTHANDVEIPSFARESKVERKKM
jgi:hypothetical protein